MKPAVIVDFGEVIGSGCLLLRIFSNISLEKLKEIKIITSSCSPEYFPDKKDDVTSFKIEMNNYRKNMEDVKIITPKDIIAAEKKSYITGKILPRLKKRK